MSGTNRQILLRRRPQGPITDDCFELVEQAVPRPAEGEAVVRVRYLSLDPTIRIWVERDSYLPAIALGDPVRSAALGVVVESRSEEFPVGATVMGMLGWQDYAVVGGDQPANVLPEGIEPADALSIYGGTGITAYFGLLDVGQPVEGDTVLVSGAAGATGSIVGQIAKIKGCRVVGIAGTDDKCRWLVDELGFDAAVNYRTEDLDARIGALCPDGVDVFFDNVGGDTLEAALDHLALKARVVLCGSISSYNAEEAPPGPRNLMNLVIQRARMEGFLVLDYLDRFPEAALDLAVWVAEGKIRHRVDIVEGLEATPSAMNRLFDGTNTGKLIVHVAD